MVLTVMTGCKDSDADYFMGKSVAASLSFSVSQQTNSQTRMSDAVVQKDATYSNHYRGLQLRALLPFSVTLPVDPDEPPVQIISDDEPLPLPGFSLTNLIKKKIDKGGDSGEKGFYLYESTAVPTYTNAFLVYGKAPEETYTEAQKGVLVETIPDDPDDLIPVKDISFAPKPFLSSDDAPAQATALAGYLTHIANTTDWSATTNSLLKAQYLNFTGQANEGNRILAGSSANVLAHVNALYAAADALKDQDGTDEATKTICSAILTNIKTCTGYTITFDNTNNKVTSLGTITQGEGDDQVTLDLDTYPASLGLPDGAAALRWTAGNGFGVQTVTTTLDNINNLSRFCYPAELYYYANSRIKISSDDEEPAYNRDNWNEVLSQYDSGFGVVNASVRSVAVIDPLQYAVARLDVKFKAESATLSDALGRLVTVGSTDFPLTGVIVCNQRSVGYDFRPVGNENHADDHFIYDKEGYDTPVYLSSNATAQSAPSTLVLQTYPDEEVVVILEFQNNGSQTFQGKNGVVYPGTKFYLIGRVKPEIPSGEDLRKEYQKCVFTQDYITTITFEVKTENGLKNAYNVLPDILGERLEVGVQVVSKWKQTTSEQELD